jgi:hypothetical protein
MKAKENNSMKYRKNFWEIKEIKWQGRAIMDSEGNGFGVCEVKDDNGNPFLKYEWGDAEDYGCHASDFGFYVGKKVDDRDEECQLTDYERVRLGLVLNEAEVEELATKGYISESSDEDGVGTTIGILDGGRIHRLGRLECLAIFRT